MNSVKINVNDVLKYYGVRNLTEYGDEINFSCPFPEHHRGDQRPSSYVNTESYKYNCFGCDREGSIVTFVAELEGISTDEAERLINSGFAEHYLEQNSLQKYLKSILDKTPPEDEKTINDYAIRQFKVDWNKAHEAYKSNRLPRRLASIFKRGFSPLVLENFQIGYDTKSNRITIPCWDHEGNLVGFKGRATSKDQRPKYWNVGDRPNKPAYYGFSTYKVGNYVWGLNSVEEFGIIVEGELDAIWLRQWGFPSLSIGGSNPTSRQINLLRQRLHSAALFFDKDDGKEAGNKAQRKLAKSLVNYMPIKIAECLPGKDPQEMSPKEIKKAIENSKSVLQMKIGDKE